MGKLFLTSNVWNAPIGMLVPVSVPVPKTKTARCKAKGMASLRQTCRLIRILHEENGNFMTYGRIPEPLPQPAETSMEFLHMDVKERLKRKGVEDRSGGVCNGIHVT